jgi:hypothetical protein
VISTIFTENKYRRWYFSIIENAKNRNYDKLLHERHHIIPKSLGGTNNKENIVCLYYREHFICHWLLVKFTTSDAKGKMCSALRMMMNASVHNKRIISNKHYEIARSALSRTKRKMSKEFKQKQSELKMGKLNPMFGRKQSDEQKEKARQTMIILNEKMKLKKVIGV